MRTLFPLLLLAPLTASAVPTTLHHQGRLFDAVGAPLDGTHSLAFALYDVNSGGTAAWSETQDVDFTDGYFDATLGSTSAVDGDLLDGSSMWLGIAVDGGAELGRVHLDSVPYAVRAGDAQTAQSAETAITAETATNLVGGTVDALEIRINGTTVIDGSGAISGSLPSHQHDASEVATGVLDIARINIGGGSDQVAAGDHGHALSTLTGIADISQIPVGSGSTQVAAGDHSHALSTLTGVLTLSQVPVGTGSSQVAAGDHLHGINTLTGVATVGQLPVGQTSSDVAAGDHSHANTGNWTFTDSGATCDSSTSGMVRFDGTAFLGCAGGDWVTLGEFRDDDGSSAAKAGASCLQIVTDHGGSDGLYWVDIDGVGSGEPAFEAWCDMSTDGGGWMLVGNVTNRWARTAAPAPFFTSDIIQTSGSWTNNAGRGVALTPSSYGVMGVDGWAKPTEIRYQQIRVSDQAVMVEVDFSGTTSINALTDYSNAPASRTGVAVGNSSVHGTRNYYYGSYYLHRYHYWGGIFGRSQEGSDGWQFGIQVNDPDGVGAYNGVNDDQNRSEFNLGVGGINGDARDIASYFAPHCTSSCNEDWAPARGANFAATRVWHR